MNESKINCPHPVRYEPLGHILHICMYMSIIIVRVDSVQCFGSSFMSELRPVQQMQPSSLALIKYEGWSMAERCLSIMGVSSFVSVIATPLFNVTDNLGDGNYKPLSQWGLSLY
jgi:hypothetical protein